MQTTFKVIEASDHHILHVHPGGHKSIHSIKHHHLYSLAIYIDGHSSSISNIRVMEADGNGNKVGRANHITLE